MSQQSPWRQWVGAVSLAVAFGVLAWQAATRAVDFPIYHRIGSELLAGDYSLYPLEAFDGRPMPPHGWRYLPAIAAAFVPFALLPMQWAALLFFALKLAALVYVGRLVVHRVGVSGPWHLPLTGFFIVAGFVIEEMHYGNAHLFVVALMVVAFDRIERGAIVVPSIAMAVAIATKLTPLALLAYFAIRGRLAVCIGTALVLGGLALAPAAVVGFDANARLLQAFARYAAEKADESDNYALRGVLDRALTPKVAPDSSPIAASVSSPAVNRAARSATATWIWGTLVVLFALATLFALRRPPAAALVSLLELSLVLTVMLIVSPHTQRRYFSQLFVPVAALLCARRLEPSIARRASTIGCVAVASTSTVLPLLFAGPRLSKIYESVSPYLYGAVVLFGSLVVIIVRLKHGRPSARVSSPLAPPRPTSGPSRPVAVRTRP